MVLRFSDKHNRYGHSVMEGVMQRTSLSLSPFLFWVGETRVSIAYRIKHKGLPLFKFQKVPTSMH